MTLRASDFESLVKEHMDAQPYAVDCSECGAGLDVERVEVDGDMDLHLRIAPCVDCMERAAHTARQEEN